MHNIKWHRKRSHVAVSSIWAITAGSMCMFRMCLAFHSLSAIPETPSMLPKWKQNYPTRVQRGSSRHRTRKLLQNYFDCRKVNLRVGSNVDVDAGMDVNTVETAINANVLDLENLDIGSYTDAKSVNAVLIEITKKIPSKTLQNQDEKNNKSDNSQYKVSKASAQKAQDVLDAVESLLLEEGGNTQSPDPRLNTYSYTIVLDAWAKCGEAQKAHDLLQRMVTASNYKQKANRIIPNTVAFNIVINAWARVKGQKQRNAARNAQQLLQFMEDQHTIAITSNKPCFYAPNTITYNAVMNCIGKSGKGLSSAKEAESILRRMYSKDQNYVDAQNLPNDISFGTVLSAYAKCARTVGTQAAQHAETLLETMEQLYQNSTLTVGPTTFCVNTVINAWSQVAASTNHRVDKQQKYEAAKRAEQILLRMEDLFFEKKRTELRPNTVSYNTVLSAWAKTGIREAPDRAEAILRKMDKLSKDNEYVTPDNISFNTVLNAWARSNSKWSAKRAESILRHMDKLYASGHTNVQPDSFTYSTCINAWARAAAYHYHPQNADGNTSSSSPAKSAEAILHRMETVYKNGINPNAKPNIMVYNAVLNVWSKSGGKEAVERACAILDRMENDPNIEPDVYSYTSVIDVCAKAKNAAMAKTFLEKMENLYEQTGRPSIKPSIRSYTSIINAFSRSGGDKVDGMGEQSNNPEEANRILERMESMYESGKHDDLKPDTVCYNAVINAYGWSTHVSNKAEKARDIYLKMLDLYQSGKNIDAKPDIVTCNSLLNACAYTKNEDELECALNIAISVYEMFVDNAPEFGELNHVSYGNMILACTNLVPLCSVEVFAINGDLMKEKRRRLTETVWWHCCQEGRVSSFVLSKFQDALSFAPDILFEILGKCSDDSGSPLLLHARNEKNVVRINDLPHQWTRNAAKDESKKRALRPSRSNKIRKGKARYQ